MYDIVMILSTTYQSKQPKVYVDPEFLRLLCDDTITLFQKLVRFHPSLGKACLILKQTKHRNEELLST